MLQIAHYKICIKRYEKLQYTVKDLFVSANHSVIGDGNAAELYNGRMPELLTEQGVSYSL
jgi:hypothetical protein